MADFPYTPNPASVKRFLEHVSSAGVPEKVSQQYLEKVGFKTKNDRYIITVLKFIGFLDSTGAPTQVWQTYRSRSAGPSTLARALRASYADLFKTYPDAHRKDNEALRNYFSAHTKVAETTLSLIVTTFKTLCGMANFETGAAIPVEIKEDVAPQAVAPGAPGTPEPRGPTPSGPPAININVQLQLPATEDAGVYEKLFAALKKHLLP